LHPSQLGPTGQGGDVEAEFLAELAGERGRNLLVSVDQATGQRVLVAAGPLTVDQRHLPAVEDDAAGADRQGGDRAGVAVPGASHGVSVLSGLISRSATRQGARGPPVLAARLQAG
jgi:hypothetical protein